ncbi:MAG: Putative Glycosyl transferase, group 1 family protein [Nitrospira sp.]|nr:MAG: Putative Glycosyl transferase, group 1 family protein [Nitrospira sp.]
MNLLLIGGLPPPVGGTTVLFKQLVDDLRTSDDICIRVIDVSRPTIAGFHNVLHALRCLALLLRHLPWASVLTFHTSLNGAITFGPVVHIVSRLFRRKWIFRGFGGDIETWHRSSVGLRKRLFDLTVLRADVLLLERKASVEYFETQSATSVKWYPNSRRCHLDAPFTTAHRNTRRRFVFVGHVKPAKGIGEIIAAARVLCETGLTVDVYGPLQDDVSNAWFAESPVTYRGLLAKEEVISTMAKYAALVLPTYWEGEGHPGVILEAYCAGIPVISTNWGGIPEIVTEETGILVEPRDVAGLANAMRNLIDSDQLLARLSRGARSKAAEFDAGRWTQYFVNLCHELTTT